MKDRRAHSASLHDPIVLLALAEDQEARAREDGGLASDLARWGLGDEAERARDRAVRMRVAAMQNRAKAASHGLRRRRAGN